MFYTCVPKTWWYDLPFLRYRVWQIKIGNYDSFFALSPLPPLKTTKIRTLKKWKINCWRYEAQQTEFFVIFDHFLPFHPNNSKNQNFQKMKKKHLEKSSFYTSVPKIMIICYTVPDIWCMTDVIVNFYFGLFFAFSPP